MVSPALTLISVINPELSYVCVWYHDKVTVIEAADVEAGAVAADNLLLFDPISLQFKELRFVLAGGLKLAS